MDKKTLDELIDRISSGEATNEELAAYNHYLNQATDAGENWNEQRFGNEDAFGVKMLDGINRRIGYGPKRVVRLWPRIAAAASILFILSAGGYFLMHKKQPAQQVALLKPGTFKNDVLPGKNNAYITLGNGKKIIVTNSVNISLAQQGNTNIQKNSNGQIVYQAGSTASTEEVYNTLVVPRGGGKRELRLADGTLAILDAGSSIHFPVAFNGKDRRVSITGQVYFEVVHNASQPFYVTAKAQTIEDIGTHFNINAFNDEPIMRTTLLEGSIEINGNILKPGQQAVTEANGKLSIENTVDLHQVIAWKNDKFEFDKHTNLQAVMRQLARWYDLDVAYQGANKQYHFAGDMPRDSKLSDLLKILEYNGLQFSIDGKKLTVYQ